MQVHCIYICFLPLLAYFNSFISFYRCFVILQYWFWRVGVFFFFCSCSFIHLSYKPAAVKLWLTATAGQGAGQGVVVKTQKIQQDKLKVHLKDKEESWIIESPTLIRTVKRARRSHHIGLTFPVTLLLLCCAAHHFHKGIRYSYT